MQMKYKCRLMSTKL